MENEKKLCIQFPPSPSEIAELKQFIVKLEERLIYEMGNASDGRFLSELARQADCSKGYLSSLKRGQKKLSNVSVSLFLRIAEATFGLKAETEGWMQ